MAVGSYSIFLPILCSHMSDLQTTYFISFIGVVKIIARVLFNLQALSKQRKNLNNQAILRGIYIKLFAGLKAPLGAKYW